jgi:hypothetical protein
LYIFFSFFYQPKHLTSISSLACSDHACPA